MSPKPITHPLAVEYLTACAQHGRILDTYKAWDNAGRPLYADPAPMPDPALGMRVWTEQTPFPGKRELQSEDIRWLKDTDCTWGEGTMPAAESICMITDYRTNEVLWRRA